MTHWEILFPWGLSAPPTSPSGLPGPAARIHTLCSTVSLEETSPFLSASLVSWIGSLTKLYGCLIWRLESSRETQNGFPCPCTLPPSGCAKQINTGDYIYGGQLGQYVFEIHLSFEPKFQNENVVTLLGSRGSCSPWGRIGSSSREAFKISLATVSAPQRHLPILSRHCN